MLRVGLTGGMGSGKTTVARIFEVLGVPVYYADDAAKRLMNENGPVRQEIVQHFGKEAYHSGGLNRPYLAGIVFKDPAKLTLLNSIVHPATLADARNWLDKQTTSYAIKEAALLFESGARKDLDFVIGVSSPIDLRIQRIMKRDGLAAEEISARMDKQMNEEAKLQLCDFIITNDEQELVIPQVIDLHEKLSRMQVPRRG